MRNQSGSKKIYISVIIILVLLVTGFWLTGPDDPDADMAVEVRPEYLTYFEENYFASRAEFLRLSSEYFRRYRGVREQHLPIASTLNADIRPDLRLPDDLRLTIDTCYIPAQKRTESLILITSGVHGAEGLAASAVQRMLMRHMLENTDAYNLDGESVFDTVGILWVHAVNPYGVYFFRRVTENNVDLNRNFDVNDELFQTENAGYREIRTLLNPAEPVDMGSFMHRFFAMRAVYNIAVHGMSTLRQAALQGQYEFPEGIYFGGQDFEQQRAILEPIFRAHFPKYKSVMILDLHTGYGERGTLHLFPNAIDDPERRADMRTVFGDHPIDWGDDADFYTTHGDFSMYIMNLLSPQQKGIPMVFEYGTLDSQTTSGSILSIHNMILENQGAHYGFASDTDREAVQHRFREMFYPSSEKWRTKIIADTLALYPGVVRRFAGLN
ncbi:MAG: DUF2817 domain-containing protein [Leptospiraceae bacterium]|nr:DUF2817 domain-containing protein [Leptospiraceae bacterium]